MGRRKLSMAMSSLSAMVVVLLLGTGLAQAVPLEQPPNAITISGSPLRIEVGHNMSIQVYHQNYEDGAVYGAADSGPFWYIDGQTYGPNMPAYGDSAVFTMNELTWGQHRGPSGSGTQDDPWRVETSGQLISGTSSLDVMQLVSYVNGRNYFQLDWTIANRAEAETCFKFYHAADIQLADSDYGRGYYDAGSGSVGGYDENRTWFMVFVPITRPDWYREADYDEIWRDVQLGIDLDNTINDQHIDNGIALQWDICLAPEETRTIGDLWSFGESEAEVIPTGVMVRTPMPATPGPAVGVDVMVRDHLNDDGSVPSNLNGEPFWMSPDIIVRNNDDGGTDFQNPIFGQTNYIYVRVRNIGTQDASDVKVTVYWADPALLLRWPDSWIGIARQEVSVPAGGEVIAPAILWEELPGPGHFCLLAWVTSNGDPVRNEGNVPGDNNIALLNLHILELPQRTTAGAGSEDVETVVVGSVDTDTDTGRVDIVVQYPGLPSGAMLSIDLGTELFNRWLGATGGEVVNGALRATQIDATGASETVILDLPLEPKEERRITIHVDAPTADPFSFQVLERVDGTDVGGNVFWYTALLPEPQPREEEPETGIPEIELPGDVICSLPCGGAILLTVLVLWLIRR